MSESQFKPTTRQLIAKARFTQKMSSREEMGLVPTSLSKDDVAKLAESSNMPKWLSNPEFAQWFFDANITKVKIAAYAEAAVDKLFEIATSDYSKPKDVIAASTKLLELADAFPSKRDKDEASKKPYSKDELDKLIAQYNTALAKMENEIVNVTPAKVSETTDNSGDALQD